MGLFSNFKNIFNNQNDGNSLTIQDIINLYYRDFPETPYVSDTRDIEKWVEFIQFDNDKLVQKKMMIRNEDGLLPGHVYLINWVKKFQLKKNVPVYFEYEFGINFSKELEILRNKGYLDGNKVTEKGEIVLRKYNSVILEHDNKNTLKYIDVSEQIQEDKKELDKLRSSKNEIQKELKDKEGFYFQNNAIVAYKEKRFQESKELFLKARKLGFYSPGGTDYLAKIYRKEKDYVNEIKVIEESFSYFKKSKEYNYSIDSMTNLHHRLNKAKELLAKSNS